MSDEETFEETPEDEIIEDSTTAENIKAIKELLCSIEFRELIELGFDKVSTLSGKTNSNKLQLFIINLFFMIIAFICIGALAFLDLIPEATTGVLAGIVIGYFFKRST